MPGATGADALGSGLSRHAERDPLANRAVSALLEFVLPLACASCARPMDPGQHGIICGICWARLALLPEPRCDRCGHPTWGADCRWCSLLPPYVRAARSVCWAGSGSGSSIVHALKYRGWWRVAEGMAQRMARLSWPRDVCEERAAVVPVPLSQSRLRERGYNQSERLGAPLALAWGIPLWTDVVYRTRDTRTQTRLTPDERSGNVRSAFRAKSTARNVLRGCHVVLVDDVITTAATLNACAAALYEGGARIISLVTFARAPALGDRC